MNTITLKKLIFQFLIFLSIWAAEVRASHFHAILVADLHAKNIEKGVKKDLENMQKVIQEVVKYTHFDLSEKVFSGNKSDPKEIFAYIKNLTVRQDDLILFYFSGHGYRTHLTQEPIWPSLSLEKAEAGISFKKIGDILKKKQARLAILIADCCNNVLKTTKAPKLFLPKRKSSNEEAYRRMSRGYYKLFHDAQGFLMIASAKPGQYSYTDNNGGSIYTSAFIKELKKMINKREEFVSWRVLIQSIEVNLVKITELYDVSQHPILYSTISEE